jgi:DNA polymerase-3 subunit epsilon
MRQIVLDTETTGLSPEAGHRLIEIGCVELINRRLTGSEFHYYLNPERAVDPGAFAVHGLGNAFLRDKPLFSSIMIEFLRFIEGAELIIHNASFDLGFINHELNLAGHSVRRIEGVCTVIDTLMLARKKYPGQKNNLDALCKRLKITHFGRDKHGALLDAQILAQVYLTMTGSQDSLFTGEGDEGQGVEEPLLLASHKLPVIEPSAEELAAHDAYF